MRYFYSLREKKAETTLNVSYFEKITENISNRTSNFISKWVEYVSQIVFKLQGTIMNLGNKVTVFQITVCETVVTKIYVFLRNTWRFTFLFEFLDNARGWYKLKNKRWFSWRCWFVESVSDTLKE